MKKVVKLAVDSAKFDPPLQFDFFATDDRRLTNTIALWDVAPRGVFRLHEDVREERGLKLIKRVFQYGGATYNVSLTPARFEHLGEVIEKYPGEREQLVEEVIRQLAVRKNRLSVQGDKGEVGVGVSFSLYEIFKELERTGHKFSYAEIREALNILHMSRVEIVRMIDEGGKKIERVVSGTTFPNLVWGDRNDADTMTKVSFNWLMSHSMMRLDFRQISYELLMRMPGPIERWLYRCISHDVFFFGSDGRSHIIRGADVIDGSGAVRRKRTRENLRRVHDALDWLKNEGLIVTFDASGVFEGRRKVDAEFTIVLSDSFTRDVAASNAVAEQNRRDFEVISGGAPDEFVPANFERRAAVRRIRAARALSDSK